MPRANAPASASASCAARRRHCASAPLGLLDFPRGPSCKVVPLFHGYPEETRGEDLAVLVDLVADGRVKPLLGLVRDWKDTLEVLDALRERRVRGKAVLTRS